MMIALLTACGLSVAGLTVVAPVEDVPPAPVVVEASSEVVGIIPKPDNVVKFPVRIIPKPDNVVDLPVRTVPPAQEEPVAASVPVEVAEPKPVPKEDPKVVGIIPKPDNVIQLPKEDPKVVGIIPKPDNVIEDPDAIKFAPDAPKIYAPAGE